MPRPSLLFAALALLLPVFSPAQSPAPKDIPALFLSDIHFDPFHDPAKAPQLAAAPVEQWLKILSSAPSPDQTQAFAALQKSCPARGIDTPFELLQSSLRAIKINAATSHFVTISGDLLAHQFDCRYNTLIKPNDPAGYSAFVEKTLRFIMLQLQATLPETPIYMALGNNDSACGDYRLDLNDPFLASTAKIVALGLPPSPDRDKAITDFAATGEYAVDLPIPNTRLLVLDDIFLSTKYLNCAGKPDPAAAAAQITWLKDQLTAASLKHQRVWVMAHIPPGIDLYNTVIRARNICGGAPAITFLQDDSLPKALLEHSDIIKLGLFGHTHEDELRIFRSKDDPSRLLPIKIVASITPLNGNNPSFTVAAINPTTATLADYHVIAASNLTGIDTTWSREYDFDRIYHQTSFTAASLSHLLDGFQTDRSGVIPESKAYMDNYIPGDHSSLLKFVWPQYVCSLIHDDGQSFSDCACAGYPH